MTLTLNKSFSTPIVEGVPFSNVTALVNFDASPITAIVGGALDLSRASRNTTTTAFSSAGSGYFGGDTDSGQPEAYAINYIDLTDKSGADNLGNMGNDPFMVEACVNWVPVGGSYYNAGYFWWLGAYFWGMNTGIGLLRKSDGTIWAELQQATDGGSPIILEGSGSISDSTWYYVCLSASGLDGGSCTLSLYYAPLTDSTATRQATSSYDAFTDNSSSSRKTVIGSGYYSPRPLGGFYYSWQGYLDNMRVVKGSDTTNQDTSIPMITEQFPTS